jgi:regulator of RNase E activity RraA
MKLLIANGYVIDPAQQVNTGGRSLLIEDGRIAGLLDRGEPVPEQAHVIDATGLIVAPGFIDMHTHLREPGQEYKETVATGASAAVAGGWTSICAMPNTDPVNDNPAVTRFIIEQAQAAKLANVFPIGAVTKGSQGKELAEMGEMKNAGIVAVVTDGLVRDVEGIIEVGLPVYARGLTPNSPFKHGPGTIGLPIALGGQTVEGGDLVVGDRNGVVIVPRRRIAEAAAEVAGIRTKEAGMDALVRSGATMPPWLEERLARDDVRYVDP